MTDLLEAFDRAIEDWRFLLKTGYRRNCALCDYFQECCLECPMSRTVENYCMCSLSNWRRYSDHFREHLDKKHRVDCSVCNKLATVILESLIALKLELE